ncbi:NAD(+) diphosphatase [Gammaproteobacteria bacterium]|nr:NAD(+) diphosphatase [Gammaproteobacteria bacterium]
MKLIRELHETIKEDSKLIIFCDNKILYDQAENTYSFAIKDLNLSDQLGPYLAIALIDNCFVYALNINEDQNILGLFMDPDVIHFVELRQMLGILDQSSFLLLSRATILKSWLSANVFCSICGNQNSFNKKEGAFECSCNAAPKYPTISPCIITLIYDEDKILLGRSKFFPPNMYSTLAGFIEAGENAEEALIREVKEEVNVEITNIKYFSSQSWPFPAQLMLGYFCQYKKGEIILNDAELEDARWFDIKELPIIPPDASISGQLIRSYIEGRLKL